jgi:hypothetical protein
MAASEELFKIAARVLLQQVATPYRVAFERRVIGAAICGVVALIAVVAAVVCGIDAFELWLTPMLGATTAVLVTMAILIVIALVLGLGAATMARRAPAAALRDVFDGKQIGSLVEGRLPQLLIAAVVGGLLFGMKRK